MNRLAERQIGDNAANRDCWDVFRTHRDKVTDLLRGDSKAVERSSFGAQFV